MGNLGKAHHLLVILIDIPGTENHIGFHGNSRPGWPDDGRLVVAFLLQNELLVNSEKVYTELTLHIQQQGWPFGLAANK